MNRIEGEQSLSLNYNCSLFLLTSILQAVKLDLQLRKILLV